jgi:glycerol uptake facilitator-like aquaporin
LYLDFPSAQIVLSTDLQSSNHTDVYSLISGGVPQVAAGVTGKNAVLVETFITFILILVFLMVEYDQKLPFGPLAVGLAVLIGSLAA